MADTRSPATRGTPLPAGQFIPVSAAVAPRSHAAQFAEAVAPASPRRPVWRAGLRAGLIATALLALAQQAEAADGQAQPEARPAQQQAGPVGPIGPRLAMPADDVLLMLVQSSILALNQANATGNYTVLRGLASPAFQQANSAERLSALFSNLRQRGLDLSPIVLFQPKLFRKPEMSPEGLIRVMGFFPTEPERVNFELIYQPVNGRWRLFGIAVDTEPYRASPEPPPAPGAEAAAPPPAPGSEPAAAPAPQAASRGTSSPSRLGPSSAAAGAKQPAAKRVAPKPPAPTAKQAPPRPRASGGSFNPFGP